MSVARRSFVLSIALVTMMCAGPSESRHVADRFMELYYGRSQVAAAVDLCVGAARTKLQGELDAMKGVPADSSADRPRVTFRLTSDGVPAATEATYVYSVDPRTSDVGPLVATLVLTNQGGKWLVARFDEKERGS